MSAAPSDLAKSDPVDATHTRAAGEVSADLFAEFDREAQAYQDSAIPAKRGAGRPAGSPNRTTTKMKAWLLAKGYRDPAEFLAAIMSADTLQTAMMTGCDPGDVLKLQVKAAEGLMPYFHQALPKQVDVKTDGPRSLIVILDRSEQFQGLTLDATHEPHGQAPHDKGKSVEDQ